MNLKLALFLIVSIFSVVVVSISIKTWNSTTIPDRKTTDPTVHTANGRYTGVLQTLPDGSKIVKYLGIPFAQPPVGELRFKKPKPLTKRSPETIIKADRFQKSCTSLTKKSTDPHYGEDCLYLNVYIPGDHGANQAGDGGSSYSVMIWLHPGGYVAGSTFPEPTKLVLRGNVIVVMVNYRMGVLGFLTTNDDALPGNNGLWDQYMAIKWVKENIRHFGGDEDSITVFGESAGSMSSHIHALSPVSSNLFQKVILQSGTASSLISRDYIHFAYSFGQKVGCGGFSSHTELATCLRNVSLSVIRQNDMPDNFNISLSRRQADFIWVPVIDGKFILDNPSALLKNQSYLDGIGAYNKDYMIGVLDNEGGLIAENFLYQIPLSTLQNVTFYTDLLDYFFYSKYGLNSNQTHSLMNAIANFYHGSENLSYPLSQQAVLDTASDAIFDSSALNAALMMSKCNKTLPPLCQSAFSDSSTISQENSLCSKATAKVFFYHFDFCPSDDPCRVPCMSHGSDFSYEFPKRDFPNSELNQMSDIYVDILTTFGKTSDPGAVLQSGWPVFEPRDQHYLRLSPKPAVRQQLHPYRTRMWLDTLPRLVERILKEN